MNENPFIKQGWECPKCGRIYSPSTSMCKYCGGDENIATSISDYISSLAYLVNTPKGFNILGDNDDK